MTARIGRAFVLAVGDELLSGARADENSPLIARALAPFGIELAGAAVVADDEREMVAAMAWGLERAPLLIATGGLGPTEDDLTRHAAARAAGCALVRSARAERTLRELFAARGLAMPEPNLRQALIPEGAELLPNRMGTAPGFLLAADGGWIAALPGPPEEMRAVLSEELVRRLGERGLLAGEDRSRRIVLCGLSESVFAERIGERMAPGADPRIGCSVKDGILSVVLRPAGESSAPLEERLRELKSLFGEHLVGEGDDRLEHVLGEELLRRGTEVTTAESCTGGLVAELITRVPGISRVFRQGFVTYADEAKERTLGIPPELLSSAGAVSTEVAGAMARGASARSGADLAIAVTGVAGPGGGSPEKPVGLVCFAVGLRGEVETSSRLFPVRERERIRALAARHALFLALRRLRAAPD